MWPRGTQESELLPASLVRLPSIFSGLCAKDEWHYLIGSSVQAKFAREGIILLELISRFFRSDQSLFSGERREPIFRRSNLPLHFFGFTLPFRSPSSYPPRIFITTRTNVTFRSRWRPLKLLTPSTAQRLLETSTLTLTVELSSSSSFSSCDQLADALLGAQRSDLVTHLRARQFLRFFRSVKTRRKKSSSDCTQSK